MLIGNVPSFSLSKLKLENSVISWVSEGKIDHSNSYSTPTFSQNRFVNDSIMFSPSHPNYVALTVTFTVIIINVFPKYEEKQNQDSKKAKKIIKECSLMQKNIKNELLMEKSLKL